MLLFNLLDQSNNITYNKYNFPTYINIVYYDVCIYQKVIFILEDRKKSIRHSMLHTQAFTCKNINAYTNYYGRRSGKFLIYLQPGYGSYFIRFYIKLNDCFDL